MTIRTHSLAAVSFAWLVFLCHGEAQILQDSPFLCGKSGPDSGVPQRVSISLDRSNGIATLSLSVAGKPTVTRQLSGVQDEIRQICEVEGDKLVVFGWNGAYNINVVDASDGRIINSFQVYDPAMSPNQQWLIFRKFYSFRTEFPVSEEYQVYNLHNSREEARGLGNGAGRVVYPRFTGKVSVLDIPETQNHSVRSSFFWSGDSRMVAFVDRAMNKTRVVVISFNDENNPEAFTASLSTAETAEESNLPEECIVSDFENGIVQTVSSKLGNVSFSLSSEDRKCNGRTVLLSGNEFAQATPERIDKVKRKVSSKHRF